MQKILFFVALLLSSVTHAQKIRGKVYDLLSEKPIADVYVTVMGTSENVVTDENGEFVLSVAVGSELTFSHVNYQAKKVVAKSEISVALTPQKYALDEILITSNPLEDITHSVSVMDDEKKGSQPRNAADLFSDISGFYLQKRSAMSLEPSLRSFKYEQLNIKFDGCAETCNACPNRMDPITAHVTPEEVQKIEVVKGPYSVRFGQTFGGVINMVTRTKPYKMGIHGDIQAGYEINGENIVTRAEIQYATKQYDFTVNGEYRDFGDYTDGNDISVPADFNTISYSLKAGYNPTEKQRVLVDWRQKFGKNIDHAGLPMDSPKDDSYMASVDYQYTDLSDKVSKLSFKSYFSFVDHLMTNRNRPNYAMMDAQTPVTATTYGGKLEFTLSPHKKWLVYTGLDAEVIARNGERTRIIQSNQAVKVDKVWQDAQTSDFGVFAETTHKFSNHVSMTGGLRLDFVSGKINDPATDTTVMTPSGTYIVPGFETLYGEGFDNTHETTVGGNLAFKYHKGNSQVQFAYGLGTRSASMIERYIYHFTVGSDGYEYVGNPFLKPEKNHQIELAFNHKTNKFNVGMAVFYSKLKDYISAIYRDGDADFVKVYSSNYGYAKQFINVDANQRGFDAFFNLNILDNLQFNSSIAYTVADNETFDEPLSQIAPLVTRFGLRFEKPKYWLDVRSNVVAEQNRLAPSFGETETTPGYATIDLRGGINLTENLKLGVSVLNIFDEAYFYHTSFRYTNTVDNMSGDRIYEPGRNFSFYAVYKF
jgi:iron complex outermembrane receptor protein